MDPAQRTFPRFGRAYRVGLQYAAADMEILTLEFGDVEWQRRILRVRNKPHLTFHIKSYQERHIPLNKDDFAALPSLILKKHPTADFMFRKKDGSRWASVHKSSDALVQKCNLPAQPPFTVSAHSLRHTFGSWLAIAGVPLRAI